MTEPWFYRVWLKGEGGLPWACVYGVAYNKGDAEKQAREKYSHWPETLTAEVSAVHEVSFMPTSTAESRRYTTMTETTETLVKFADRSEKIIAFIEDRVTEMRNEQVAVNVAAEAGDVEAFNAAVVRLGALAERIKMAIDGDPDNVDEALAEE